jgi:hypothetical protein
VVPAGDGFDGAPVRIVEECVAPLLRAHDMTLAVADEEHQVHSPDFRNRRGGV